MARAPARQELFLSVGGSVAPLTGALKVGKTALIEFSGDAEKAFEAVERSMRDMVKDPGAAAKQLTQSYSNAFREIRANAQNVLGANDNAGALTVLNANAAREAATAAENRAAAIRVVAEAARAEAIAQGSANAQLTAYASAATVAEREAEQYAIALREQANTLTAVEGRMNAIVTPGKRIVEVSGQARAGMQQLSFQLGDVAQQIAANTPLTIIFAQQIGQVTQAIGLMTGETKGFLGFIGGPWGMAISSALVLLTPLIAKVVEGKNAIEEETKKLAENAKQTAATEAAKKAYARTADGLIAKVREETRAWEEQNRTIFENLAHRRNQQRQVTRDAEVATTKNVKDLTTAYNELSAIEARVATLRRGAVGSGAGAEAARGQLAAAEVELERKRKAVRDLETQARDLQTTLSNSRRLERSINVDMDEAALAQKMDAERAATDKLADAVKKLDRAYANGEITRQARATERLRLQREHEAEVKRIRDSEKARSAAPAAERATPSVVGGILKDAFGGSFSGTRSAARNRAVDGAARSYHLSGQAVDFVPAGGMGSVTKAQVRAALEAQGVQIKELLGPGDKGHSDHFHVAFSKARQSRESIEKKQESLRQRELAEDVSFVDELRQSRRRLLDAQGETAVSEEQRAKLLLEEIDAEASGRARKIGLQLSAGKLDEAEAAQLLALNEETRQARRAAIAREGLAAAAEKQLAEVSDEVGRDNDLLRSQLQLADTREDRARIERQLLDNAYRIEINDAAIEIASAFAAKDWDRYAKAIARAADLAERKSNDEKALDRQNEGSYDRYRRELGSVDSINDQIENLKIDSVRRLGDELAGAATKALGLKGALGDVVGQLIRIGIERQLLGPAADFLFGPAGGGGGGGLLGKLFGFLGFADGGRPDRAVNGRISGPGSGRSDSILALLNGTDPILVSNGESIVNAEATQRYWPLIDAMNRGQLPKFADGGMLGHLPRSVTSMPANDVIQGLSGRGTVGEVRLVVSLTDDLDVRIDNRATGVAVQVVRESVPTIVDAAAASTAAQLRRPGL